jgi:hypothetical protein
MTVPDNALWDEVFVTEQGRFQDIMSSWVRISAKDRVLIQALETPHQRGTALRLLLLLGDEMKINVFATLVELAAVGHSDIALCRSVIKSMLRQWVIEHIESLAQRILERSGEEEEYRRFAELYLELDASLLERHVQAALAHANPDVREVGSDFRRYLSPPRLAE